MSYIRFLVRTRGLSNMFSRAVKIFQRFSVTPRKSRENLLALSNIAQEFGFRSSVPATAILLNRYPKIFKELQEGNIEFAIHGLYHRDYSKMAFQEQYAHMQKAESIFEKNGIFFKGFRAPYLSWNTETLNSVRMNNFVWSSNRTILWDVLEEKDYSANQWKVYKKVLQHLYKPLNSNEYFSLPRDEDGVIEIPVSVPEDEIISDRLEVSDTISVEEIYLKILKESYERGELYTVMVHPERVPIYMPILRKMLATAKEMDPPIWITSLSEIAEWWKEKIRTRWSITEINNGAFRVVVTKPDRGKVVLKDVSYVDCDRGVFQNYSMINKSDFIVKSKLRPLVGVSTKCPPSVSRLLSEEGWFYEISEEKSAYSLYLEGNADYDSNREKHLASIVDSSDASLIRLWRWPHGAQSALSVTSDIDCLTLIDFFMRLLKK